VNYFADRIVLPYKPKVIAFYAGDNDVAKGKSAKLVFGLVQSNMSKGNTCQDGLMARNTHNALLRQEL